jgi:hypothetical protein
MAFGKKKAEPEGPAVTQADVSILATQALQRLRNQRLRLAVTIRLGDTLMNRWDNKSLVMMLGKMTGHDVAKGKKDLDEKFQASWYRNENGLLVMPCRVIKAAIVEGAISTRKAVTKAELNRELRVLGYTSPINLHGKEVSMDLRITKNQSGVPDVRARALVPGGSTCSFVLDFAPILTVDKVMMALDAAGSTIGLCDFRPDRGGEFGTFSIERFTGEAAEVERVIRECAVPEEQYEIPEHMYRAVDRIREEGQPVSDTVGKAMAVVDHVRNGHSLGAGANGRKRRAAQKGGDAE